MPDNESNNNNTFDSNLHEALPELYMTYALSVIKDRSLPDIRDGLKPVLRRSLYAMNEMNLVHSKPYRKSASVVGEVMGKYHPHGDGSIYHTIARLAQPWVSRYMLIDGQGNYGSVDDDPVGAMRYTEMKLLPISEAILDDIDKDTVDFVPNYDGSLKEPKVLPTKLPLLLLNGSIGIAVGMATTCAPHNLSEVVDATIKYIEDNDVTLDELLTLIKGPDFPTGAMMFIDNIREIYETGRGSVVLRARAEIEDDGKYQTIIIKELPYQLNKSNLIVRIGEMYREQKDEIEGLDGISDIRDESSEEDGIRLVIELRKGVKAESVLNMLYRRTELQTKYSISMMALVDNQPKYVNLKMILENFVKHRKDVIVRRARYNLRQAQVRMHLLEGFLIVFKNLNRIIEDIKTSTSSEQAYERLHRYGLSDVQAKSILDMRVQRIAQFEQQPIVEEHAKLTTTIADLTEFIASDSRIYRLMKEELVEVKRKYGDRRRTRIINAKSADVEISEIEEVQEEDVVITVTKNGNIKRTPMSEYRVQRSKGRGAKGVEVKDDDAVEYVFNASSRDYTLAFTNMGRCYKMSISDIPSSGKGSQGKLIKNILDLSDPNEKIAKVVAMDDVTDRSFMMVTKLGQVKKIETDKLKRPRSGGMVAMGLDKGDELIDVILLGAPNADILLVSKSGLGIRFPEQSIRPMGRSGSGVLGMRLDPGDEVISVHIVNESNDKQQFMTVTNRGFAKQTPLSKFRPQRRSGRGVICMETSPFIGAVIAGHVVANTTDEVLLTTSKGIMIRFPVEEIKSMGRNCRGCKIQKLEEGDNVSAISVINNEKD